MSEPRSERCADTMSDWFRAQRLSFDSQCVDRHDPDFQASMMNEAEDGMRAYVTAWNGDPKLAFAERVWTSLLQLRKRRGGW